MQLYHPLTLTTFRLPFAALAGEPGVPGAAPGNGLASWAFIPAFTVSIRTPVEIAGEYGDSRFASAGWGSGGMGNRLPPDFGVCVVVGDFDLVVAGCLPLLDVEGLTTGFEAGSEVGREVMYGGLGMVSGFKCWIWKQILSRSCFSTSKDDEYDYECFECYNLLVLIDGFMSRPSFFHSTLTRPGLSQSRG